MVTTDVATTITNIVADGAIVDSIVFFADTVANDGYLYVTAQNASRFGILKVNDERVLDLTKR